ncbi:MAG: tRNA (N(6)-L-threonylcarbamoyladenosine(37)-C(2))-methylthiotransferase MtaB [Armatimonadetes bacterium CG07_land_8_20_14_0_80_59_28]|nr:MAG: tRNA (N(6)-L-threonylcarbamoyladenosine(37)-C(2))-methylthiotransferase MtaB [Armatimonadetes bacterium CG07_land_8_20_14_0_80_59_28]
MGLGLFGLHGQDSAAQGMHPRFAIYTLGCKANQYDSFAISRELILRGWQPVSFDEPADAYIIDTCTVTSVADRKSRKVIRRAGRAGSNAIVAVTGCAAEWAADKLRQISGVELVVGNRMKNRLADDLCRAYEERPSSNRPTSVGTTAFPPAPADEHPGETAPLIVLTGRARFLLKIQDGCNRRCAFCIVPHVRGKSRSRPVQEVVNEAHELIEQGIREVVLTGIQLGDYGRDLEAGRRSFLHLVENLTAIDGLLRLRVSSMLPQDIDTDLLSVMANSAKVCPHLHIPLQSGSDRILKAMHRGYTAADFLSVIDAARTALPDLGLTTDIMVGFPDESNEDFNATVSVAEQAAFSDMHIFKYSQRPGTEAAQMPEQVEHSIKEQRSDRLFTLSAQLNSVYAETRLEKPADVLLESVSADGRTGVGYTETYLRASVRGTGLHEGELVTILPRQREKDHLIADVLHNPS